MRVRVSRGSSRRREDGAVAILVSVLTLVFALFLAFVVDFGLAHANKRPLQSGVDAGALAVGEDLALAVPEGATCPEFEAFAAAQTDTLRDTANDLFGQNADAPSARLLDGAAGFSVDCEVTGTSEHLVVSTASAQESPGFFGQVAGAGDISIGQEAKVIVGPAGTVVGLRPFALCEEVANLRKADPDAVVTIDFSNADAGCGTAAGNFGTLDLRTPSTGSPGELAQYWTRDGFPDPVSVTDPMIFEGSPGTPSNSFGDDFQAILDEPVVIPVYDVLDQEGSHSRYRITGFVAVTICGTRLGPSQLYLGSCLVPNAKTTDTKARWVQFQFTKYIPIGSLNLGCRLGDACDTGLRVVKLAD